MVKNRAVLIVVFVAAGFLFLLGKLFVLQVLKHEEYSFRADNQQMRTEDVNAERGMIFDRDNVLLAYSKHYTSFYLYMPLARKSPEKKVERLLSAYANVTGKPITHYRDLLNNDERNVCLEKKLSGDAVIRLKDFHSDMVVYQDEPERVYPFGNLASHIIGFVNSGHAGVDGVEKACDQHLSGKKGTRVVVNDVSGRIVTVMEEEAINPVQGNSVVLTIDRNIQAILEEELKAGAEGSDADYAVGIVMDPRNGEILAMASSDAYDLNNVSATDAESRRNKLISDIYEPGSTFKAIALSAFLDAGICRPDESLFCENGKFEHHGRVIKDVHPYGDLTVEGVLAKSSNIGMAKLSDRLNSEVFYKYLRGYGFGNFTNVALPGEVRGILRNPTRWNVMSKGSLSYGYEVSVTPIQMAAAYAALINGGTLYEPKIIQKEIESGTGAEYVYQAQPIRQVISEKTSQTMRNLMISVVEEGTAKAAKIEGVTIGGKTGTSRRNVGGKYTGNHYASFIGFFPAEQPEYLILVMVNNPKAGGSSGGANAAPIFKRVAERILHKDIYVPKTDEEIEKKKDTVKQKKKDDERVEEEKHIPIYVARNLKGLKIKENGLMPDLTGLTVRDAGIVANKIGLSVQVQGSGRVTQQSISYGTSFKKGGVVTLTASNNENFGAIVY